MADRDVLLFVPISFIRSSGEAALEVSMLVSVSVRHLKKVNWK